MKLRIFLFAGLAELLGGSIVEVEFEQASITVQQLKNKLIQLYPHAEAALQIAYAAKNQAYASLEESLSAGDEIALIPPVSGGEPKAVSSEDDRFVITWEPISSEEVANKVICAEHGAALTFIGTTREWTNGQRTVHLEYEAYVPMALKTLKQIADEMDEKWPGTQCAITHRLGKVDIAETSVVIAVSSPHRADCYDASRYAIERLKQIVPIWKKEIWEDGSEWKGHQQGPWNPLKGDQQL